MATDFAAEYPYEVAAVMAMSGISGSDVQAKSKIFADSNLPLWVFHNVEDEAWPIAGPQNFVAALNSLKPAIAPRFTIINVPGHNSWSYGCNPYFKEDNMNIYEWMLQYHR
jgi:predicted peptidase